MEHTAITIKNFSSASIELYRWSNMDSKETITMNDEFQIPTLEKDCIHGHSSIGSFVITRSGASFSTNIFGKLSLLYRQEKSKVIFEVVEKR